MALRPGVNHVYSTNDHADTWIINQVAKCIMGNRLRSLALDLRMSDAEISRIMADHHTTQDRAFRVRVHLLL